MRGSPGWPSAARGRSAPADRSAGHRPKRDRSAAARGSAPSVHPRCLCRRSPGIPRGGRGWPRCSLAARERSLEPPLGCGALGDPRPSSRPIEITTPSKRGPRRASNGTSPSCRRTRSRSNSESRSRPSPARSSTWPPSSDPRLSRARCVRRNSAALHDRLSLRDLLDRVPTSGGRRSNRPRCPSPPARRIRHAVAARAPLEERFLPLSRPLSPVRPEFNAWLRSGREALPRRRPLAICPPDRRARRLGGARNPLRIPRRPRRATAACA